MEAKEVFDTVQDELKQIEKEMTPQDIEKIMVDRAREEQVDPVQTASMLMGLYTPKYEQGVEMLSSRGKTRLLKALIEYPFDIRKYQHTSELEKTLVQLGNAILEAKAILVMSSYNEGLEQLVKAADNNTELTPDQIKELGLEETLKKE